MDPLTAGLGIANLGASIFGGMAARRTQANIANAQVSCGSGSTQESNSDDPRYDQIPGGK